MMGKPQKCQPKLFYHGIVISERIPVTHPLRKIKQLVDFGFVRRQVANLYGIRGHSSVDPEVILKLMFLLFYENVKSERSLMEQLPLRLDWLWFCGYDLDDLTPNHSVISKARRRWGAEVFVEFFTQILQQCLNAGLIDGKTIHIDSSMIDGNVAKDTLKPQLRLISGKLYNELENQSSTLETESCDCPPEVDAKDAEPGNGDEPEELSKAISPTDPDARLGKKYNRTTLGYKDHRVIDDKAGIITATIVTPADTHDAKVFTQAIETHQDNTNSLVTTAVADKAYGNNEDYKYLKENNIKACIPHQRHVSKSDPEFSQDKFTYDAQNDCYICPAGKRLDRYDHGKPHYDQSYRYRAPRAVCQQCPFFGRCVDSKVYGRQISRNLNGEYTDWADHCLTTGMRRRLLARRKAKAEGSFADATNNHGFKRARWRGLIKMRIQNLLIAAIQNLRKLLRELGRGAAPATVAVVNILVFERLLALITMFCPLKIDFSRFRREYLRSMDMIIVS